MESFLDLSTTGNCLFSGKQNGEALACLIKGEGKTLNICVREGQLVTSSFMFGLLLTGDFTDISITKTYYDGTHRSEVTRALKRYNEYKGKP